MRTGPPGADLERRPLTELLTGVVLLAGFFAVLVALSYPLLAGFFLAGGLTAVVLTASVVACSRRRAVCIPGTAVCVRVRTGGD